jgi:Domain of unknown function (DUF4124)
MSKWMFLLAVLAPLLAGAEPAWRWVDADGVTHYSDRPVPGAEQVELQTSAPRTPIVASTSRAVTPAPGPEPAAATPRYTRFDIVSPTQQETLWNIGTTLDVQVAVAPQLLPGHHLDVTLDGQRQRVAASGSSLTLTEVYRGIHTVQAVIVDAQDAVVLRSAPVEFMVQQTSIQNPSNPNRPARPTPTPN